MRREHSQVYWNWRDPLEKDSKLTFDHGSELFRYNLIGSSNSVCLVLYLLPHRIEVYVLIACNKKGIPLYVIV